jgi:Flp pilus assembly protein TadG
MLTPRRHVRPARRRVAPDRRAVAALEFAIVAPLMVTMVCGVYDFARALIAWEETCSAAQQIAQAAEKLSVTAGSSLTSLTSAQMQDAMTTIYAQMPGLNLGNGTGSMTGAFAVTLSGIAYTPLCSTPTGCAPQAPATLWSTYLTQGGTQLMTPATAVGPLRRSCGKPTPVATFPDDSTQLSVMISPGLSPLTPQVVADVRYVFTPSFPLFPGPITFWASAAMPSPYGDNAQEITLNTGAAAGVAVACP